MSIQQKKQATIDIDIGGTFTDCFIRYKDKSVIAKSPTTGYDLSVCFMKSIEKGAAELGLTTEELLTDTEVIRYSTTVAMNKLIQRKGPKLALITSEGFEDVTFIGKGSQWQDGISSQEARNVAKVDKPQPLIPRELVVGVKERIDSNGNVVRPLNEEDFRNKLQYLVDQGVMGFVVCLLWSFKNPVHEQRIKQIIKEDYPEFFLGNMPVFLSHAVLPKRFEYSRANVTILNAYLHQTIAEELAGIGDELRDLGYDRSLLMVYNTGGMGEVYRTAAVNTYNGGPVSGVIGSSYIGKLYGYDNVVFSDMGGTSFDLGLVVDGSTRFYQFHPVIDRWRVDLPIIETKSIGAGGGSIAWINTLLGNRLEVGPQSAGSFPGPAAFDQGGTEPTVTDADLILGYIDPDYYHGGELTLNLEKARKAIHDKIARPLGIDVVEAAALIKKIVDGNMGNIIHKETALKGYDPKDFVLFAMGGAGATHCCGYGFHAGISNIVVMQQSPVFCAFSSSLMDVKHIYEESKHIILLKPGTKEFLADYDSFNEVVYRLKDKALRDIRGEGFKEEQVVFELEADMKFGGQLNVKRTKSPVLTLESREDVQALWDQFTKEYSNAYSPLGVYPEGGVEIENIVLHAIVVQPKYELPEAVPQGTDPSAAWKGKREAYWEELKEYRNTDIYQMEKLSCGNVVSGPAIIESSNTTVVLPPGAAYTVDKYLNGLITKTDAAVPDAIRSADRISIV
ncbi:hydantoinase/oxoprolinase family protein [Paenibacillus validus]|uniref:hydantoinase/oxoprolinase family protein n=1 Tax=Paenibacillus validus TaxID=44253 RepID=UPI0013DF8457|nr:hydantoinase/oxoprolinase family protein [Paenibacillus validus]MED4600548.1 hydantoinase/oxoprolinase family protein [Paenibacillus validus]MED4606571.1 hydantoinase/oxoprolinase family protein [Paenibacillus validus]